MSVDTQSEFLRTREAIPAELCERSQWVIWREERRHGRLTKVPYQAAHPARHASSTDPATWCTFDKAFAASVRVGGIGYVFSPDDPFVGVDFDKVTPKTKDFEQIIPEIKKAVGILDSYTEWSVHGRGLHVIVRGSLEGVDRHRRGPVEMYDRARFFVVTGNHVDGTPHSIEFRRDALNQVIKEFLLAKPEPTRQPAHPVNLDDRSLLDKMFAAKNGERVRRLWQGDASGYPSYSEADAALCAYLAFWTGRDPDRIDSLFRQSGLMRGKWERTDYRQRTIENAITYTTETYELPESNPAGQESEGGLSGGAAVLGEERPSQSLQLVRLAEKRYRFLTAKTGESVAVPQGGPNIARLLRGSGSLRAELAAAFAAEHGKVPNSNALTDGLNVLEGRALAGPREGLSLRVARDDADRLVLDLGDDAGTAAVVSASGWELQPTPVLFRRSVLTGELPQPEAGGSLDKLRRLLNIGANDWPLLVGWLVAALIPEIPHAIAAFVGQQGSAKSWAARLSVSTIDPSASPTRTAPRDVEGWAVAASGSWMVALDNVSKVPDWLSDALCRAVTGDGLVRRRLYSDSDLSVLTFRRVIALTAIDPGALRGDLADRLVRFELEPISEEARRQDADVRRAFEQAHPVILGGLLDLAVQVLKALPRVQLRSYPRMADFARIVAAVDAVMGTNGLDRYLEKRGQLAEDVVDDDPVARVVRQLAEEEGQVVADAPDLLERLTQRLSDPDRPRRDWPESPRALQAALLRCVPALSQVNVTVEKASRCPVTRRQLYRVSKGEYGKEASPPSEVSQGASETPKLGEGSSEGSWQKPEEPSPHPKEPSCQTPVLQEGFEGPEGSESSSPCSVETEHEKSTLPPPECDRI